MTNFKVTGPIRYELNPNRTSSMSFSIDKNEIRKYLNNESKEVHINLFLRACQGRKHTPYNPNRFLSNVNASAFTFA